jgi:hypothetical protein
VQTTEPRERHLIIAVFANESAALEGFRLLQRSGFSPENVAIVGKGYRDADAVGFADPVKVAKERALRTAGFTGIVGSVMGLTFNLITHIQIVPNQILTWAIAAFLGGISGVMGGLFVGGGVGLVLESGESISYRNRIEKGKYLLLVEGQEALVLTAQEQLRGVQTESLERYYFRNAQG